MVDVFCLKPIKTDHESWPGSRVGSGIKWAKVWAGDSNEARYKMRRATDVRESKLPKKAVKRKYDKIRYEQSPWELPDVTSCELDLSEPKPGHHILLSDGRQLPLK